jgi:Rieske Fe-S protein
MTLVTFAEMLQACGGSPTSPSDAPRLSTIGGTVTGRSVSVTIDGTVLSATGSAALVSTSLGSFLVTRTAEDAFSVLTAVCTHEGCEITGFEDAVYVCPCHGSRFGVNGGVLSGPASTALRQFASQLASGTLTWTV